MSARLVCVGVGPGDPGHLTVNGLGALRAADVVFVPAAAGGAPGRAEGIVVHHVPEAAIVRLDFPMTTNEEARRAAWQAAGERVARELQAGRSGAFATLGDPSLYSTVGYLVAAVREVLSAVEIELVPGITAMQALAARSATILAEGDEAIALVSLTGGVEPLRRSLEVADTVVCYKSGRELAAVLDLADRAGRLGDAVYGARLGLPDEVVRPAAEMVGRTGPYLSAVLLPPPRARR